MANLKKLTRTDREFFATVKRAAFSNPFGSERQQADRVLAGKAGLSPEQALASSLVQVRQKLDELHLRDGSLTIYADDDRLLLQYAVLFNCFHRHMEGFDRLIAEQVGKAATPCKVPFARQAIEEMVECGLAQDQAVRYFAFFFQMRRAFYFLTRTIVGQSRSINRLRQDLWSTIFTSDIELFENHLWDRMEDYSTLLLGETGTGKGAAAAAIGLSGFIPFDPVRGCFVESFTDNFTAVNLAQYAETLLESELFGHKKGAFTGAIDSQKGVFALCNSHGSIFLDEIGDVPVPVQIKLLQVLQERSFSPVGSRDRERFSGRVLAATNHALTELRESGRFRHDFYYRLCANLIEIPPLRQRIQENPNELELLVEHLLQRSAGGNSADLVPQVLEILESGVGRSYHWPGNVRELEQAIRRILLVRRYDGEVISSEPGLQKSLQRRLDAGDLDWKELLAGYCRLLYDRFGTYEEVARRTDLDRRTVKKYIVGEETEKPG